jgi:CRP/FNR family transcriptional regulator
MTNENISTCADCTEGWHNFKVLSKEQLELVESSRYEASFNPGEVILKQNTPASNAVFLRSGMAKIYMEGQGNRKLIISIAKPGKLIVGPGIYTDTKHTFSVSALTECTACFMNTEVIKSLVKVNNIFAEGLLEEVSHKAQYNMNRLLSMTQKKMPGRVAEVLLYLADKVYLSDEFKSVLSRQELAELAGMAKESIVRILKDFSDEGIICSDCPDIKILDKEKLKMISING